MAIQTTYPNELDRLVNEVTAFNTWQDLESRMVDGYIPGLWPLPTDGLRGKLLEAERQHNHRRALLAAQCKVRGYPVRDR
jgi:hypothetical protein